MGRQAAGGGAGCVAGMPWKGGGLVGGFRVVGLCVVAADGMVVSGCVFSMGKGAADWILVAGVLLPWGAWEDGGVG